MYYLFSFARKIIKKKFNKFKFKLLYQKNNNFYTSHKFATNISIVFINILFFTI